MASPEDGDSEIKVKCTLCKSESPNLHCNTCRINLCPGCVGDHTTSQLTIQHNIVAYELRDTNIKHPACTSHVNFSCDIHCEDCSVPVCSQCCTETHQGHKVTDITELYNTKQKIIQCDIEISEELILPEYEKIISDIRSQISILKNEYQKLRMSISKQGEIWHQEINNVISKYQKEIDEMEMDDLATLLQHLSEMENQSSLVKEIKQKNRDTLNSKNGNNLLKYDSKNKEMRKIPQMCQISPPTFKSLEVTLESLYKQFGNMTISIKSFTERYTIKIPHTPEEITTIDTGYNGLGGISCKSTEQVWIIQYGSRDIRCIDVHGSLQQTVTTKYGYPYDLTVTKQGHLVYTDGWIGERAVYRVRQGKTETIIRVHDWIPLGVCSTSDGDLLVCMTDGKTSKVVRYCGSTVKQKIMNDDKGQLLYGTSALFITENTNKDVWVSDVQARAVVVTDQSGKFKFRYTGNLESNKYKTFCPFFIDSDSQGHILVIGRDNNCVHIIDDKGHLLCYIKNLSDPRGLSVDSNDHVWISKNDGKVKVIKYLKC